MAFFFATTAGVPAGVGLGARVEILEPALVGFEFGWLTFVCLFLLEQPSSATANTTASAAVITAVAGIPKPKIFPIERATLRGLPVSADFICVVILITSAAVPQHPCIMQRRDQSTS